jgi:HD-like signal output (HDOD) protein
MQAGFAFLEAGATRAKNSVNVMMKNYMDMCLGAVIFWAFGYGLMYGTSIAGLIGSDQFVPEKIDNVQYMQDLWSHSAHVAAISAVLAHKTPGFDPDRAMLAGLIHDIGIVPILAYADRQPEILANPADLAETVRELRTLIGVQIVRKWDFPSDFEDVVIHAEDWYRDSGQQATYSDIVMVSQLHSFIGKIDIKKMPKMDELPAYKKLAAGNLDVDLSIDILDQVRDEIETIRQMLN